jgi:hypothetical protein
VLPVPSPSRQYARVRDMMVYACTNVASNGASDALAGDRIATPFAAARESLLGTSRHFNALRNLVTIGGVADIDPPHQSGSIYEYVP